MTENKGIALEEMFREFIIPYIKTKLNTKDEIVAVLDSQQVKQLDTWYLNTKAMKIVNRKIIDEVLNGNRVSKEQQDEMFNKESAEMQAQLGQLGNTRYIKPSEIDDKTWKDIFKDFNWEIEVEVTNEQSDKEAMMTTLTTVLQTIAQNPNVLQDPIMKTIFSKIVEATGALSPIEISQQVSQPAPQDPQTIGGV
jgi:hypothetical protein